MNETLNAEELLNLRDFAILTATLELLGSAESPANTRRNDELFGNLLRQGYQFRTVTGFYGGVNQGRSFMVFDISEKFALKIANSYQQESIITERGLVFVDGSYFPAKGILTGEAAIATGNYTKLPDGFCFSFQLDNIPTTI